MQDMAKERRDQIINWLNDAVGMEENLIQVLDHQVNDFKDYPQIQQQIRQHLDQTKGHADMVRQCIKDLGGSPSGMKQTVAKIQGLFGGIGTGAAGDELVKNLLSDFGAENFEIGCYTSLISACNQMGESKTASVCQQILSDEQDMAQKVLNAIPTVTNDFLMQKGMKKAA